MHRGASRHMLGGGGRNKELLEATVSCLWRLESARDRQERLVLDALAVTDTPKEHASKWQQKPPQVSTSGLMDVLQELCELTADSNAEEVLDSSSSSGFYEQSEIQSPPKQSRSSPCLSIHSQRHTSAEDAYMPDWEEQKEFIPPRSVLPRSLSAPFSSLEGIAEGTEEEENDETEDLWSNVQETNKEEEVNRTDLGFSTKEDEDQGLTEPLEEDPPVEEHERPTTEDIPQVVHGEAYIVELLQQCALSPTSTSLAGPTSGWQDPHGYLPIYSDAPSENWHEWPTGNESGEGANTYQEDYYQETGRYSQRCEETHRSSINTNEYEALEPYHCHIDSEYVHPCISPTLNYQSIQQNWTTPTVEVAKRRPLPRNCLEPSIAERYDVPINNHQPEDSFLPHELDSQQKFYTVGQSIDYLSKDCLSTQRMWSSSADLRTRETLHTPKPKHLPFHTLPQSYAQSHHLGSGINTRGDSSLSETYSPGSSSVSSDSDESGGLVWPQELPPCLSSFSQIGPTAMVKIKASHALKKKIMRFRSGSLKVMTTV